MTTTPTATIIELAQLIDQLSAQRDALLAQAAELDARIVELTEQIDIGTAQMRLKFLPPKPHRPGSLSEQILRALQGSEEGVSPRELCVELDQPGRTGARAVTAAIERLLKRGEIRKKSHGRYVLA